MAALHGTELFKNAHVRLSCDYAQGIVILQRTALAFQRLEEVEAATEALARALPHDKRAGFSILSDFRSAPVRVTPALEPAFARFRQETERGFSRAAIVVSTPVGRVRSDRLKDTALIPVAIVETVELALEFLKAR
jgi:hypothetical protein